jgi:hypothetical protein
VPVAQGQCGGDRSCRLDEVSVAALRLAQCGEYPSVFHGLGGVQPWPRLRGLAQISGRVMRTVRSQHGRTEIGQCIGGAKVIGFVALGCQQ